eukprot:scaffold37042_cov32-Tisochrysis_lutea.AAC.2
MAMIIIAEPGRGGGEGAGGGAGGNGGSGGGGGEEHDTVMPLFKEFHAEPSYAFQRDASVGQFCSSPDALYTPAVVLV